MRRFRFTLRTMLIVFLGCAIVLMIANLRIQKLQQVAADIDLLRECGAIVELAPVRRSLLTQIASDFEGYPIHVRRYFNTSDVEAADEIIAIVERNPTIETTTITGCSLSDSQVQRLLSLPLRALSIDDCNTGDTLDAEASSTLEWLSFHRTRLNDNSLKALGDLPKVEHLDLTRTRVSDASIEYLAGLPSLQSLCIPRCKITAEGKRRLETLRPDMAIQWEPLRK